MNEEDFVDRIESALEQAGSHSPIPRVIEVGGSTSDRDARLLNAAQGAVELSRQRALRKYVHRVAARVLMVADREDLDTDSLVKLNDAIEGILADLIGQVLDDVAMDVRNKLRVTAAVHPAVPTHTTKENP